MLDVRTLAAVLAFAGIGTSGCKGSRSERQAAADAARAEAQASPGDGGASDAAVDAGGLAKADTSGTAAGPAAPADDAMPERTEDMAVRARHLLEAIANDDAALATDILFPRNGWIATRDIADPGRDWDRHVAAPFRRSVHTLSRRREELSRAQFVSLELGPNVEQVTPRRRSWKLPLWTVRGSHVTFVVDGRTRTLVVREMIAWRGAWYVTRLR
jgi:hypothetical protein